MGGSFKPSIYTSIRYGHPCAQGLFAAFVINEDGGPVRDLVTGSPLTFNGAGARFNSQIGQALDCRGNDAGGYATAWQKMQDIGSVPAISILWRGTINSSPSAGAGLAEVTANNSGGSPFIAYGLDFGSTTEYRVGWSSGGTFFFHTGTPGVAWDGSERQIVAVVREGPSATRLIEGPNAVSLTSQTATAITPTFTATSLVGIGINLPAAGRDSKSICKHAYFFNRNLEQGACQQLYVEPYAFIGPYRRHFAMPVTPPATSPGMYYYQRLGAGNV